MSGIKRPAWTQARDNRTMIYMARVKRQITWSEFYELLALNQRIFLSLTIGGFGITHKRGDHA